MIFNILTEDEIQLMHERDEIELDAELSCFKELVKEYSPRLY